MVSRGWSGALGRKPPTAGRCHVGCFGGGVRSCCRDIIAVVGHLEWYGAQPGDQQVAAATSSVDKLDARMLDFVTARRAGSGWVAYDFAVEYVLGVGGTTQVIDGDHATLSGAEKRRWCQADALIDGSTSAGHRDDGYGYDHQADHVGDCFFFL